MCPNFPHLPPMFIVLVHKLQTYLLFLIWFPKTSFCHHKIFSCPKYVQSFYLFYYFLLATLFVFLLKLYFLSNLKNHCKLSNFLLLYSQILMLLASKSSKTPHFCSKFIIRGFMVTFSLNYH